MTAKKNLLNDKQFQIIQRENSDTVTTNEWLKEHGLDAKTFGSTNPKLLHAQKEAHELVRHHRNLLSDSQYEKVLRFYHCMTNKRTRERMNPNAAYAIFNISSKINRQLFKQHRKIAQA